MKTSWAWMVCATVAGVSTVSDIASASKPEVVEATELEIVEHTVVEPPRGKDDKENYWIQMQIWGEMKNKSNRTVRLMSADITFYDAQGKSLGIASIGTAMKQDLHDASPGERIYSVVHDVPPGGSAPFHYMRNYAAIKGLAASHKLTMRPALVAQSPAVGVAVGVKESVGEMTNPALPNSKTLSKRRAFEGTLRNDGKGACKNPKLVVALLSPEGKIRETHAFAARATDDKPLTLAPAASAPFKGAVLIGLTDPWQEKAAVKSYVDCESP
jgi:hypothetical protein